MLETSKLKTKHTMEYKNKVVYVVRALYNMGIMQDEMNDERIIIEVYDTQKLAQERCRQLIDEYKNYRETYSEAPYGDVWNEEEFRLSAYSDGEWNVKISYEVEEDDDTLEDVMDEFDGNDWDDEEIDEQN